VGRRSEIQVGSGKTARPYLDKNKAKKGWKLNPEFKSHTTKTTATKLLRQLF
jgi:hypothetical protein